jgi:cell surface protein SprA
MRANYEFSDNLSLGATMMKLAEKPITDKFRVGEEPLNNLIWGMDGSYEEQNVRWLTRAVDALPLIETRAPSNISVRGEFAQLRPGHAETVALERTQQRLNELGLTMNPDERNGVSFIDDFEGVENSYELDRPGGWRLTAPPAAPNQTAVVADSARSNWRGSFSWYQIPRNLYERIDIRDHHRKIPRSIRKMHPLEVEAGPGQCMKRRSRDY